MYEMNIIEIPEKFYIYKHDAENGYKRNTLVYKCSRGTYRVEASYRESTPAFSNCYRRITQGEIDRIGGFKTEFKNTPISGVVIREFGSRNDYISVYDPRGFNISINTYWFTKILLPKITIENGVIQEDLVYCVSDLGNALCLVPHKDIGTVEKIYTRLSDIKKQDVYLLSDHEEGVYAGKYTRRSTLCGYDRSTSVHFFVNLDTRTIILSGGMISQPYGCGLKYSRPVTPSDLDIVNQALSKYSEYFMSTPTGYRAKSLKILKGDITKVEDIPPIDDYSTFNSRYIYFHKQAGDKILRATFFRYKDGGEWRYLYSKIEVSKEGIVYERSLYTEEDFKSIEQKKLRKDITLKDMIADPEWECSLSADFQVIMEDGKSYLDNAMYRNLLKF